MQGATGFLSSWGLPAPGDRIYGKDQHRELERHFRMDAYPDRKARAVLATRLHLREPQVRAWFLGRRASGAGPHRHGRPRAQRFPGLRQPPPGDRALHVPAFPESPRSAAEGPSGALPPPGPWGVSPMGEASFGSDPGCIAQEGVAASAWPQGPYVSDRATPRGSADLPSALEAFQRLSVSTETSGYHTGGGLADEDKAGPGWF